MNFVGKVATTILLILLGVGVTLGMTALVPSLVPWSSASSSDSSLVVDAIDRTEEVSLLSVGVQGLTEVRNSTELFGFTVPGSDKASFIEYSFNIKLGIDGSQVQIEETAENAYKLSIPEFVVIGSEDPTFKTAVEDNGILSWATADVSELETVNTVLDDDTMQEYVASYEDLLQDQTEQFYGSIIRSIDPDIELDFVYAS